MAKVLVVRGTVTGDNPLTCVFTMTNEHLARNLVNAKPLATIDAVEVNACRAEIALGLKFYVAEYWRDGKSELYQYSVDNSTPEGIVIECSYDLTTISLWAKDEDEARVKAEEARIRNSES